MCMYLTICSRAFNPQLVISPTIFLCKPIGTLKVFLLPIRHLFILCKNIQLEGVTPVKIPRFVLSTKIFYNAFTLNKI